MKTLLISVVTAASMMLVLDMLWLGTLVSRFYTPHIGHLMAETPRMIPAVIFYVLFIAGIYFFILGPALAGEQSLSLVFIRGALFGLVTYGTYDLTNQATLKDWPAVVTVVDMIWGTLLSGSISTTAVFVARLFV